jgi:hypothetical protein
MSTWFEEMTEIFLYPTWMETDLRIGPLSPYGSSCFCDDNLYCAFFNSFLLRLD